MQIFASKTKDELIKIKDEYIGKYIGDFDKPSDYRLNIKLLDKLINLK